VGAASPTKNTDALQPLTAVDADEQAVAGTVEQALQAATAATPVVDGRAELSCLAAKGADKQADRPPPKPPRPPTGARARGELALQADRRRGRPATTAGGENAWPLQLRRERGTSAGTHLPHGRERARGRLWPRRRHCRPLPSVRASLAGRRCPGKADLAGHEPDTSVARPAAFQVPPQP